MRPSPRFVALLGACLAAAACNDVTLVDKAGTGGGSTSGSGSTTSTGQTSTGGQGGAGGASTTSGQGGGTPSACDVLGHAACVAAYPDCAPVYDDDCCPSCDPTGGCADCVDIQFHHCAPLADVCGPAGPACGQVPGWACSGGSATCGDPGGSVTPCASVAGCVLAVCDPTQPCMESCHPVTAGSCTSSCDAVPPPCPAGTIAESDGFCYTGFCIPADVCGG